MPDAPPGQSVRSRSKRIFPGLLAQPEGRRGRKLPGSLPGIWRQLSVCVNNDEAPYVEAYLRLLLNLNRLIRGNQQTASDQVDGGKSIIRFVRIRKNILRSAYLSGKSMGASLSSLS
jgi:hypothetical protein